MISLPYQQAALISRRRAGCLKILALTCALATVIFILITLACLIHILNLPIFNSQNATSFCATCYIRLNNALNLSLERVVPLGVLFAGLSLCSTIQSVRFWVQSKPEKIFHR